MADSVGAKFVMITFSSAVVRVRRCAVSVTLTSRSLGFFFLFKRQSPLFMQCELSHNIVLSNFTWDTDISISSKEDRRREEKFDNMSFDKFTVD